jgi:hypothetical protein
VPQRSRGLLDAEGGIADDVARDVQTGWTVPGIPVIPLAASYLKLVLGGFHGFDKRWMITEVEKKRLFDI